MRFLKKVGEAFFKRNKPSQEESNINTQLHNLVTESWKKHVLLHERWVKGSKKLENISTFPSAMIQFQQLGRVEIFLRNQEEAFFKTPTYQQNGFDFLISVSNLWIFGLFELVRTIEDLHPELKKFKGELVQLRIPLAKHQGAGSSSEAFPDHLVVENKSIGWAYQSTKDGQIYKRSRQEISDKFLSIFESI